MSRFEQLFNEAYSYYKKQQYDLALQKIKKAEELPHNMISGNMSIEELNIFKGTVLFLFGDFENAQKAFVEVLKEVPKSVEACIGLGKTYYAANMKYEAKTMFEWAVKNDENNKQALEALSSINIVLGFDEKHNSLFLEENNTSERSDFNIIYDSAYEKFLSNNFELALEELNNLENLFNEDLNMLKGNLYLALEDLDKCKISFEAVLKANSQSVSAYNGLGKLFTKKNMFKDAKAMYEVALKIAPQDNFATLGLAEVNERLGLPPVHNIYTFLADKQISEEVTVHLNSAYELFEGGKFSESLIKLDIVEKLIQNSKEERKNELLSSVQNFKGFNYLGLKKLDEAHNIFEYSLRLNPGSSQACAGLGEYFYLMNRDKESKTMFEWAIKNNPDNYFAIQGLAKVNKIMELPLDHSSLDLGVPEEINNEFINLVTKAYENFDAKKFNLAIENIEDAIKLLLSVNDEYDSKKQLVSLSNFKGFNYLSLGENQKAKECFEYSLEKNPHSSQASAGLGELLFLEGKDTEAKTMYQYALEYEPRNAFAIAGLQKVNKSLNLSENDNSLVPKGKKEKTEQLGKLVDSAYILFEAKKYEDALILLDEAELIVEDNFSKEENYETLARICNFKGLTILSLGDEMRAKSSFEKALQLSPQSSQACAGLGEVFYLLGRDEEAKVMYEWAVKNNAKNNFAIAGLAKVNKELGLSDNHNSLMMEN
ncbi:MAG: tetratricopeptide repeat protein [bacterium]